MSKSTNLVFSCDISSTFNQQLHHFHLAFNATNVERSSSTLKSLSDKERSPHKISISQQLLYPKWKAKISRDQSQIQQCNFNYLLNTQVVHWVAEYIIQRNLQDKNTDIIATDLPTHEQLGKTLHARIKTSRPCCFSIGTHMNLILCLQCASWYNKCFC